MTLTGAMGRVLGGLGVAVLLAAAWGPSDARAQRQDTSSLQFIENELGQLERRFLSLRLAKLQMCFRQRRCQTDFCLIRNRCFNWKSATCQALAWILLLVQSPTSIVFTRHADTVAPGLRLSQGGPEIIQTMCKAQLPVPLQPLQVRQALVANGSTQQTAYYSLI